MDRKLVVLPTRFIVTPESSSPSWGRRKEWELLQADWGALRGTARNDTRERRGAEDGGNSSNNLDPQEKPLRHKVLNRSLQASMKPITGRVSAIEHFKDRPSRSGGERVRGYGGDILRCRANLCSSHAEKRTCTESG